MTLTDHEAQLMAKLPTAEWEAWRTWGREQLANYMSRITRELVRANAQPDWAELQFKRGYIAGFEDALDGPETVRRKLERERIIEKEEVE